MSHPPYKTWMPLGLPESILVTSLKKPSSILCKNFKMMQLQLGTVFAWCSCLSFPVYVSKVTFCHNQWPWIFPLGHCGFFLLFWVLLKQLLSLFQRALICHLVQVMGPWIQPGRAQHPHSTGYTYGGFTWVLQSPVFMYLTWPRVDPDHLPGPGHGTYLYPRDSDMNVHY